MRRASERVSRLLDEAEAFLRSGGITEAETRLATVATLSPREERYFLFLSQIRERQERWREAIDALKEGNSIIASHRPDRRADPALH